VKRLAEMTWPEAEAARKAGALALLPIGSTEAHGPHLPLATDVIISEELARRVSDALDAKGIASVVAPSISYAVTEYAGEFAGTLSLSAATATAMVREVSSSLVRQGFPRVVLVNSHLEPDHLATLAAAKIEGVLFPDACSRRWARTLSEEFKKGACHAGAYETSLVLAARPALVKDAIRAGLTPKPIDLAKAMKAGIKTFKAAGADQAYFGDPSGASVAHGEELYGLLVTMVTTEIAEAWPAVRP
jgi:creatinine amidohydrolase